MNDVTQILLIAVITVLTTILSIIGIQIVHILREFRTTIQKINKIITDAGKVTEGVSGSLVELAGITSGIRSVLGIFNLFSKKGKKREEKNE